MRRREQHTARARVAGIVRERIAIEQPRDAEVEQLRTAVLRDQNVRGFDVAVHDQVCVRVLHRRAHFAEQLESRAHVESVLLAPRVDRQTVHVLERKPRPPFRGHAAIENTRKAWMFDAGEDAAFAEETAPQLRISDVATQQLERRTLRVLTVCSFRAVDRAHTAARNQRFDPPHADAHRLRLRVNFRMQLCEETVERAGRVMRGEQSQDFRTHHVVIDLA